MTGIILAGGKNTRLKTAKSFLKIGNETIIENIMTKFKSLFDEIIIVTNNPELFNHLTNHHLTKIVNDVIPDKGSLGGIYSGLVISKSKYNFVVACDMPFINGQLINYMKNNCDGFDVIIPKLKYGYEALHSIYSKNCIGFIKKQLQQNKLKIIDFFPQVKVKEINEDTIKQFDSKLVSFLNINTNADYQQALGIAPSPPT